MARNTHQPEVGKAAYDAAALQLTEFFQRELAQFLEADLNPLGRRIIEYCLAGGSVDDYVALLPIEVLEGND